MRVVMNDTGNDKVVSRAVGKALIKEGKATEFLLEKDKPKPKREHVATPEQQAQAVREHILGPQEPEHEPKPEPKRKGRKKNETAD